jgi:voltage-gated potassium channel
MLVCGFWALAVVVFGIVERLVDPKSFHSIWLGMWWAIETVTTVGYGDIIPDQTAGKVIAGFLMLGGLSLISVLTAVITSGFVAIAQERRRASGEDPIGQRLDEIAAELRAVGARLDRLAPPTDLEGPTAPEPR